MPSTNNLASFFQAQMNNDNGYDNNNNNNNLRQNPGSSSSNNNHNNSNDEHDDNLAIFGLDSSKSNAIDSSDLDHFENSTYKLKRTRSVGLLDEFIAPTKKLIEEDFSHTNHFTTDPLNITKQPKSLSFKNLNNLNYDMVPSAPIPVIGTSNNNNTSNNTSISSNNTNNRIQNSPNNESLMSLSQNSTLTNNDSSVDSTPSTYSMSSDNVAQTEIFQPHDDNDITFEPKNRVDYFSYDWTDREILKSWRYVVDRKRTIDHNARVENSRLENASWRTWARAKYCLKTVTPESINWKKDTDVSWLYGPKCTPETESDVRNHLQENKIKKGLLGGNGNPSDPTVVSLSNADIDAFIDTIQNNTNNNNNNSGGASSSRTSSSNSVPVKPILKQRKISEKINANADLFKLSILSERNRHFKRSFASPIIEPRYDYGSSLDDQNSAYSVVSPNVSITGSSSSVNEFRGSSSSSSKGREMSPMNLNEPDLETPRNLNLNEPNDKTRADFFSNNENDGQYTESIVSGDNIPGITTSSNDNNIHSNNSDTSIENFNNLSIQNVPDVAVGEARKNNESFASVSTDGTLVLPDSSNSTSNNHNNNNNTTNSHNDDRISEVPSEKNNSNNNSPIANSTSNSQDHHLLPPAQIIDFQPSLDDQSQDQQQQQQQHRNSDDNDEKDKELKSSFLAAPATQSEVDAKKSRKIHFNDSVDQCRIIDYYSDSEEEERHFSNHNSRKSLYGKDIDSDSDNGDSASDVDNDNNDYDDDVDSSDDDDSSDDEGGFVLNVKSNSLLEHQRRMSTNSAATNTTSGTNTSLAFRENASNGLPKIIELMPATKIRFRDEESSEESEFESEDEESYAWLSSGDYSNNHFNNASGGANNNNNNNNGNNNNSNNNYGYGPFNKNNAMSHNVNTNRGYEYYYDYNSVYVPEDLLLNHDYTSMEDVPQDIALNDPLFEEAAAKQEQPKVTAANVNANSEANSNANDVNTNTNTAANYNNSNNASANAHNNSSIGKGIIDKEGEGFILTGDEALSLSSEDTNSYSGLSFGPVSASRYIHNNSLSTNSNNNKNNHNINNISNNSGYSSYGYGRKPTELSNEQQQQQPEGSDHALLSKKPSSTNNLASTTFGSMTSLGGGHSNVNGGGDSSRNLALLSRSNLASVFAPSNQQQTQQQQQPKFSLMANDNDDEDESEDSESGSESEDEDYFTFGKRNSNNSNSNANNSSNVSVNATTSTSTSNVNANTNGPNNAINNVRRNIASPIRSPTSNLRSGLQVTSPTSPTAITTTAAHGLPQQQRHHSASPGGNAAAATGEPLRRVTSAGSSSSIVSDVKVNGFISNPFSDLSENNMRPDLNKKLSDLSITNPDLKRSDSK